MVRLCSAVHPSFSKEVLKLLSQNYIVTITDFLKESASKLSIITKLSLKEVLLIQQTIICQFASPVVCCKDKLDNTSSKFQPTRIKSLDDLLGGGLPIGKIIEICGLSGTGMSRLCHKIATNAAQNSTFRVVYFDTKGDFAASTIIEILRKSSFSDQDIVSTLNRIIIVNVWNMHDLINYMYTFKKQQPPWNIGLFVVDSLPSLILQFQADKNKETCLGLLNEFVNVSRLLCNIMDSPMIVTNIQTRWVQSAEVEDDCQVANNCVWLEKRTRSLGKYWRHIPNIIIELDEALNKNEPNVLKVTVYNSNFGENPMAAEIECF